MTLAVNLSFKRNAIGALPMASTLQLFFLLFLCLSFLTACGTDTPPKQKTELNSFSGQVMGTWYHVKYLPSADSPLSNKEIEGQLHDRLSHVDQLMSTYKPDSEVSRFNASLPDQWFSVSAETLEVISLAQQISEKTSGAFDISVAKLVNLWGFGPEQSKFKIPETNTLQKVLDQIGYQNLQVDESQLRIRKKTPLLIDLSAIAKGYGVDEAADYLDSLAVESYLVEVGGEIRTRGLKPDGSPWRIAIESPNSQQRDVYGIIDITDLAVATSGDYRNYFEQNGQRFSHTINPTTGYPIKHNLASVTVIGQRAAEVDALATAFSVMGLENALRYATKYNVAAYFIVKKEEGFVGTASDRFTALTHKAL